MDDTTGSASDPFAALSNEEVRILPPDYALKKIIGEEVDLRQIFNAETIEKAQEAINAHRDSFVDWVKKDIEQLEHSYETAKADPAHSEAEIRKLAKAAFIIKSQAGTFGYLLATQVAKSLDDFCNHDFKPTPDHMTVVKKHIETLSAIFQKNITGDGGAVGKELSGSLQKLIDKYKKPEA